MARTNRYTCKTCGTAFERCIKCMIGKPDFDAENFCDKDHEAIYSILSKHGCNLITADEAIAELKAHNIDEIQLAEDVAVHIARIKSEATIKEDAPVAKAEAATPVQAVQQSNKKHKKKW